MKYREKLIKFGLNVAYNRKYRLLTQAELAERANISESFLEKLENPNIFTAPSFETICKLAEALEISESRLLDFGETIENKS